MPAERLLTSAATSRMTTESSPLQNKSAEIRSQERAAGQAGHWREEQESQTTGKTDFCLWQVLKMGGNDGS